MHLKEKVLSELILSDGFYCSGEKIASQLGVSRTAIWKTIEQLKAQGCQIEASTNRGYLLTEIPDLYCQGYLEYLLHDTHTNWQIQHFNTIDSTNRLAKQLAAENAPSGTVILSDCQTSGRGRTGKSFHSPQGGLYLSVIERLDMPVSSVMSATACAAVAVYQALQEFDVHAQIKWVNDLFLNQKKICGILSEGSFNAELVQMDYLIIGIGINLHPDPALPESLKDIVTDIQTETGIKIRRCDLTAAILRHLETYLSEIEQHSYLNIYKENSCTLGHHVRTDTGTEGLAVDFSDDAGLIIKLNDGSEQILRTGSAAITD